MRSSFIKRGEAVVLLVALLASPALVQSRDEQPATVGAELTQALSSLDILSARAALDANDAVLDTAARLRFAIDNLRYSGDDVADRRAKDLSAEQSKTLEGIQSGMATLRAVADEPAEQAREQINDIRQLTGGLSPAADQPAVVGSAPSILVPTAGNDGVVALTGRRLAKADPRLFFGDVEATRTHLTDQQALFALPAQALRGNDRTPLAYSGRLLLSVRKCHFLRCRQSLRAYTVSVVMLPTHLATVRVGFDRKKTQKIYEQAPVAEGAPAAAASDMIYRRRFEYSTEDLTVMSCMRESQAPHADGFSIDTGTLMANVVDHSGEVKWQIVDPSATGFAVELCAQPQIDKMGKTAGSIAVETTWKEFRVGDVVTPREWLEPEALSWGAELKQTLPADTNTIEVDLEYFDGARASFAGTSNDRFVSMTWNPQTRELVLTPRLRSSVADLSSVTALQ